MTEPTANDLIEEHLRLRDELKALTDKFDGLTKPHRDRIQAIHDILLATLNTQKIDSIRADAGTAYKSSILSVSVKNRDEFINFVMDKWDEIGNEMLLVSAQKDAVKNWMESSGGPPPGITTSTMTRVNIRRS